MQNAADGHKSQAKPRSHEAETKVVKFGRDVQVKVRPHGLTSLQIVIVVEHL